MHSVGILIEENRESICLDLMIINLSFYIDVGVIFSDMSITLVSPIILFVRIFRVLFFTFSIMQDMSWRFFNI